MPQVVQPLIHNEAPPPAPMAARPAPMPPPPMPAPPPPMPQVAPPPAAPPPPSAAEMAAHFQSVNRSLPDGVKYEPIDKETLKMLQDMHGSGAPQQAPAASGGADISGQLQSLAQDERNAHIFYTYFAQKAGAPVIKDAFAAAAQGAQDRMQDLAALLAQFYGKTFTPADATIQLEISEGQAIALACAEELKTMRALAKLQRESARAQAEPGLARILAAKVLGYCAIAALA